MSGQAAVVKERPTAQLSKDELSVLRHVETDMVEAEGHVVKDALCKWVAVTWRRYIGAGCDPAAVVERLPQFIRLFEDELASLRYGFQRQAAEPDDMETPTAIAQNVKEDLGLAQAAEALIERLRQKPWSGGVSR